MENSYGWSEDGLKHDTSYRVSEPIVVDGNLDESSWQVAPRSPRFEG